MPAQPEPVITIDQLNKTYGEFTALNNVNLTIQKAEIFALLGPNGAGKTTLISIVCGMVNPSSGRVTVAGFDIVRDYRKSRQLIGLVPQELTTDAFETVWASVSFSRGLFGKPKNPDFVEQVLKDLSLWDKKDEKIMALSGGMKRRLLIAKALSHEPEILFLDEPTAGVDVELRKDMWNLISRLRDTGVNIILTTHYIEEAEGIADRIGIISKGSMLLVENKADLVRKLGRKQLILDLRQPLSSLPLALKHYNIELHNEGLQLTYTFDASESKTGIAALLSDLSEHRIGFKDLNTRQSSLEDIFVTLVKESA